jgi:hypothetical protein
MPAFVREASCPECGRDYQISGASINPGAETEAPRRFRCVCGGSLEAFIPGSVNLERLTVRESGSPAKPPFGRPS